jgi:hypothetical protein
LVQLDTSQIQLARSRLDRNPHIREFLSEWVQPGFREPLLGNNILLDLLSDQPIDEEYNPAETIIAELERTLRDGKEQCSHFGDIFRGSPSENLHMANSQTVDKLAEAEAFVWLRDQGFIQLSKLPESSHPTVDFIAERGECRWGIEVTRLGMPRSPRKTTEPFINNGWITAIDGKTAAPKIETSIWEAITNKLAQLKAWHMSNLGYNVLLVISTGHCFGLASTLLRKDGGFLFGTWCNSLEAAFNALSEENRELFSAVVLLNGSSSCVLPPLE